MRFVDTNVLLYAVSTIPGEAAKARVAQSLLECDRLLSEDLAHGRDYDGVRVENPFRR